MNDKQMQMALMKIEVKLALDIFKERYKKVSKGIEKLYADVILTNDFSEVENNYKRFFGYIQKSKNSKEKWKDEPD